MKTKTLFFLYITICSMSYGQGNDLRVVASAGASFETGNLSLEWTLGEMVVDYYDTPGLVLSQGFHQPVYQLVAVKSITVETGMIAVFPNPFSDAFTVKMNFAGGEKGEMELFDSKGTSIWKKQFEGNEVIEHYAASALPSGSYHLMVSFAHDALVQSYQLLKMQ